jgi:hypothetical protein
MANENNALVVQETGFLALADTDNGAMTEELDGLELQFERIKIPSGGGIVFEVPGEDGEPDTVKDFSAVILYHHPLNCYYSTKYTGGSNPPDCGSFDGVIGVGNPGGECKKCPLNQYESADEGKGKACKNRRRIYVLRAGEVFPMLLSLPTGSLKTFTKYLQSQISKKRSSNSIITKFSLKKATNAGGIAYSQAVFMFDRVLTPEEQSAIKMLTEQVKSYAVNVGFEDINIDSETGEVT